MPVSADYVLLCLTIYFNITTNLIAQPTFILVPEKSSAFVFGFRLVRVSLVINGVYFVCWFCFVCFIFKTDFFFLIWKEKQ